MKVAISCEFAGYPLKKQVKEHLIECGYEVLDVGQLDEVNTIKYPEAAANLARCIQRGDAEKGILICGTGAGVSIVANKFKGIYAVACESLFTAQNIPVINAANVITMGYNVVGRNNAFAMVDAFLAGSFAKDCLPERQEFLSGMLNDVKRIENENFK